jgi:exosortase/archaeosortase family protein
MGNNQINISPVRFVILFLGLFFAFYYFNIAFFSATSHGKHYVLFFDQHLNYIHLLRQWLLTCSKQILTWCGYTVITNEYDLLTAGRGIIRLVYSCLGLGMMSFFTAFVIAYPRRFLVKLLFLLSGLLVIQLLNICRFVLLSLFWEKSNSAYIPDHHTIFNITMYIIIAVSIYFWVRYDDKTNQHAN